MWADGSARRAPDSRRVAGATVRRISSQDVRSGSQIAQVCVDLELVLALEDYFLPHGVGAGVEVIEVFQEVEGDLVGLLIAGE